MSDQIIVALIGFGGTILGAIIGGKYAIEAAKTTARKEPERTDNAPRDSKIRIVVPIAIGGAIGLVLGTIITISVLSQIYSRPVTPTVSNLSFDLIVGMWSGNWSTQQSPGEGVPLPIRISIEKPCDIGSICGTLEMPSFPCSFHLKFLSISPTSFTFSKEAWQGICGGAITSDTLQPLPDGTLLWAAGTGKANGVLRKVK